MAASSDQGGDDNLALLLRFLPPQVFLCRANVATDCISDRKFETEILQFKHHKGHCRAVVFVPPQVQQCRANISTDSLSDRTFEAEVVQPKISAKRKAGRPGPPRQTLSRSLKSRIRLSSFLRNHCGQLDFVPPQVLRSSANIATDCISDRSFTVSKPGVGCTIESRGGASPAKRRRREDFMLVPLSPRKEILAHPGPNGLSHNAQQSECIAALARIALLGHTMTRLVEESHHRGGALTVELEGTRLFPRPRHQQGLIPVVPPGPSIVPLGIDTDQPQCQIELPSTFQKTSRLVPELQNADGESSDLLRLAEMDPRGATSLGSLDDLHGQPHIKRLPPLKWVCIACRPYLDPPRGRWLRFCVCPHRSAKARRPRPPLQMRLLIVKQQKRQRRERGRWQHLDGRLKRLRRRCVHDCREGFCGQCGPWCCHGEAIHVCKACQECPHGKPMRASADGRGVGCEECKMDMPLLVNGNALAMECEHGESKYTCRKCNACEHGLVLRFCSICTSCPHGKRKEHCTECSGCIHQKVRSNCKFCSGCPHQRVRRFCVECNACEHGKRKQSCIICSPCPHGRIGYSCKDCKGCPHGKVRRFCKICNGCPHGRLAKSCKECKGCPHGRVANDCRECNGCEHNCLQRLCKICNGCPHGRQAKACVECNGCPHGHLASSCQICSACPHGHVRRECSICKTPWRRWITLGSRPARRRASGGARTGAAQRQLRPLSGAARERAEAMASIQGVAVDQCERNTMCTRGLRHRGFCKIARADMPTVYIEPIKVDSLQRRLRLRSCTLQERVEGMVSKHGVVVDQCGRNPMCTRGLRHGGCGGPCTIVAPAV